MALLFGFNLITLFFLLVVLRCFLTYSYEENELGTLSSLSSGKSFNVDDYGAKGDGISDDTRAFKLAWQEACSTSGALLSVPSSKKYLLKPITFSGPCKSGITVEIDGKLLATDDRSNYKWSQRHWLLFSNIKELVVQGHGTIDGNGKIWWENSCKVNKKLPCKDAPTAVTFYGCNNLTVRNFKVQNAQKMHMVFEKCKNVKATGLTVTAPQRSPNTDGIHVTRTRNIQITSCIISTGDDCISIVSGSHNVRATRITCGPGHGISIGSLGAHNSKADVSDVIVDRVTFDGTTNGVRIKTWQGGSGTASRIQFQNLKMKNVANPIIIDQSYCDQEEECQQQDSAVQVKDVTYESISGTSSSQYAVVFNCSSSSGPCQGITMKNVNLVTEDGTTTGKAICNNVKLTIVGSVSPRCS
ncbi:Polygalacturonase 1 [Dionaea muscipula]